MLSKIALRHQLKTVYSRCQSLSTEKIISRVAVENENHTATSNEQFKYKPTKEENFLSTQRNGERLTSYVEKIQVLSTPTDFVKSQANTMSEVSKDRLGQWPIESEAELQGQGLQRLKNGRFNKVSRKRREKEIPESEKNR